MSGSAKLVAGAMILLTLRPAYADEVQAFKKLLDDTSTCVAVFRVAQECTEKNPEYANRADLLDPLKSEQKTLIGKMTNWSKIVEMPEDEFTGLIVTAWTNLRKEIDNNCAKLDIVERHQQMCSYLLTTPEREILIEYVKNRQ